MVLRGIEDLLGNNKVVLFLNFIIWFKGFYLGFKGLKFGEKLARENSFCVCGLIKVMILGFFKVETNVLMWGSRSGFDLEWESWLFLNLGYVLGGGFWECLDVLRWYVLWWSLCI